MDAENRWWVAELLEDVEKKGIKISVSEAAEFAVQAEESSQEHMASVKKKCKGPVKRRRNRRRLSRHVSELCRKSRATIGRQQHSWKTNPRPCSLVLQCRSPMDDALIQSCGRRSPNPGATQTEYLIQAVQQAFYRRFKAPFRSGEYGRRRRERTLGRTVGQGEGGK